MASAVQQVGRESLADLLDLERTWASTKVMARVIYAVVIRESRTRHGTSVMGYAWALVDPLVELAVMIVLFSAFGRQSPIPVSLPVFIVTGLLPYHFFKDCMSRGSSAASANAALLMYPQVKVSSVIVGRVLLEFATNMVIYALFVFALKVITGEPVGTWYDKPLQMFLALCGIFMVGLGGAFFSSSMTRLTSLWGTIWAYLGRPLWYLSGIFFSLSTLPNGPKRFMVYNPLAHMLEWWRSVSLSAFDSDVYSPLYVVLFALALWGIGLSVDRLLTLVGAENGEH